MANRNNDGLIQLCDGSYWSLVSKDFPKWFPDFVLAEVIGPCEDKYIFMPLHRWREIRYIQELVVRPTYYLGPVYKRWYKHDLFPSLKKAESVWE